MRTHTTWQRWLTKPAKISMTKFTSNGSYWQSVAKDWTIAVSLSNRWDMNTSYPIMRCTTFDRVLWIYNSIVNSWSCLKSCVGKPSQCQSSLKSWPYPRINPTMNTSYYWKLYTLLACMHINTNFPCTKIRYIWNMNMKWMETTSISCYKSHTNLIAKLLITFKP